MKKLFGDYEAFRVLGKGSFGTVYLATQRSSQRLVALKEVPEANLSERVRARLDMEIQCQQAVQSEYVVALLDSFALKSGRYIALEYCAGGDLDKFLKKNGPVSESIAQRWMQQLANGLKELIAKKIMHRDLKLQNILLMSESTSAVVKLADFGMSKVMEEDLTTTRLGSPIYMAPELFVPEGKYDLKADVWSLGIVLYQMLTGELPLDAKFKAEIPLAQRSLKPVPLQLTQDCRDLLTRMLAYEPSQRISFDELFTHPFIAPQHPPAVDEPEQFVESSNSSSFGLVDEEIEELQSEGDSPLSRSQTDLESTTKALELSWQQYQLLTKAIEYVRHTTEVLGLFALAVRRVEMLKVALDQVENLSGNGAFAAVKTKLTEAYSEALPFAEAAETELAVTSHRLGLSACTGCGSLNPTDLADYLLYRYGLHLLSEGSVEEYILHYPQSASLYSDGVQVLEWVASERKWTHMDSLLSDARKRLHTVQKLGTN